MAKLTGKNALICGDSRNLVFTEPFDLTGYDIRFTVRAASSLTSNDDSNALIAKTSADGITLTDGIVTIELSDTDTRITPGTYKFDIQLVSPASFVSSTRPADIEFIGDVTKDV